MRACLLILFLSLWVPLHGQLPLFNSHNFEHEYQDLKVSIVYSGQSGFIWFGTQFGLFQYDGMTVTHFRFPDSIPGQSITVIMNGQGNTIYVGTSAGNLYFLKQGKLVLHKTFKNKEHSPVSSIAYGEHERIWVGTNGSGLYALIGTKQFQFTTLNGLEDDNVNCLETDSFGKVWCGTDAGISIGEIEKLIPKVTVFSQNKFLPDPFITALLRMNQGEMAIGSQSQGVTIYNSGDSKFRPLLRDQEWSFGSVVDIIRQKNQFWIASETGGLIWVDNNQVKQKFDKRNSKINNRLNDITEDKEGNVWVADKTENVISVSNLFSFIHLPKTIKGGIQSICIDRQNVMWLSDLSMTYGWENGKFISLPNQLSKIKSVCIYCDSNGNIWFGTFGQGVFVYQPVSGKLYSFTEKDGLANNNVISISGDKKQIWFATLGGVSCYQLGSKGIKSGKFYSVYKKYGLPQSYYYQIFIDSKGNIWFASDGMGVYRITNNHLQKFSAKEGLTSDVVNSICEDINGDIWFNSPTEGLYKYHAGKFLNFSAKDGIRELGFGAITGDNQGNLIVVNGKGIDMINIANGNILYHDKEIGFFGSTQNNKVIFKDKDGKIWIGSGEEIVIYDPSRSHLWDGPKPMLKKAYLFLKEFSMDDSARTFNYNENYISFDYIGIWYHLPEEVNYLIKLEGYDPDWIKSRNIQVTYPSLPPGYYTFRMKALPSNNFKTSKELSYSFLILKPFYQTIWFIGIVIIGISLILWWFYNRRIKKLKELEKINNDKVRFQLETLRSQVNPHFLFNSFNTLSGIIEMNPPAAVEYVEHLSDFFRNLLQYKEKDVISIQDELSILDDYIFIQKRRFRENFNVEIDQILRDSEAWIAPMTLQILVENAIKHNVVSKAHPLQVLIQLVPDDYILVANLLQAKNTVEISTQIGLSNIISRYAILQNRKVIIDKSDQKFSVKIPLIKYDKSTNH